MVTVCDELDISVKQVNQYLREGRLSVSKDSPIGLGCERCNTRIETGRYCDSCVVAMSNQFSTTAKSMRKKQDQNKSSKTIDKMRYLNPEKVKGKG